MAKEDDKPDVKELEKLPLDKRIEELKKIMSSKKKEITDIETLFNKSITEKAKQETKQEEGPEPEEFFTSQLQKGQLEEQLRAVPSSEQEQPKFPGIDEVASIYERLQSYNQMAKTGVMDYNAFNNAIQLYNQINQLHHEREKGLPGQDGRYLTAEKVGQIASSSKRLFEEISSQYKGIVNDYRAPNSL